MKTVCSACACCLMLLVLACGTRTPDEVTKDPGGIRSDSAVMRPLAEVEPVSHDTDVTTVTFQVGNDTRQLFLSRHSLNDSAVSVTLGAKGYREKGKVMVRHNKAYRLNFEYAGYLLDTLITKELFSSVLRDSVLANSEMLYCRFCFVRSNTLYFQAMIGKPMSDDRQWVSFNVFFRGPKRGIIYGLVPEATECLPFPSSR